MGAGANNEKESKITTENLGLMFSLNYLLVKNSSVTIDLIKTLNSNIFTPPPPRPPGYATDSILCEKNN